MDQKIQRIKELSKEELKEEIWSDHQKLSQISKEKSQLQTSIDGYQQLESDLEDHCALLDLIESENDSSLFSELESGLQSFQEKFEKKESESLLKGEQDSSHAYVSIHSGAGGTEAQDWVSILYRMYTKWSDKMGYKVETLSLSEGDEAGIKAVTFLVKGLNAYGQLKGESGVHRLVRISPFDSNSRRHTSFGSVFSWPEIDTKLDIVIASDDLRIDTYRASGAGGQHVNTTDSAVRITHIPSGVVVQCQNERSQHANKDRAMKMLKAALYQKEMEKREQEKLQRESSKKANEWGSQIRSYVLQPYQMVKDHRTGKESPNPEKVLDGHLQDFILENLKQGFG